MPEQPPGDEDPATPGIDPTVPHGARVYDYLLGGVTNFEVDRQAAAVAGAAVGGLDVAKASARSNRMFLAQAVRHLAGPARMRQFLDIDILDGSAELLDLDEPVAVVLNAVLHHIPGGADPHGVVARLMDGVAPGSYLAMSHLTDDLQTDEIPALSAPVPSSARYRFSARSRDEFSRFFDGLDLVDPGVVPIDQWPAPLEGRFHFGAVARKP